MHNVSECHHGMRNTYIPRTQKNHHLLWFVTDTGEGVFTAAKFELMYH